MFYVLKLYYKSKDPCVIHYYKRKGNATKRAEKAVLHRGYDKAEVYLTNAVFNLNDNELKLVSYIKTEKQIEIIYA